PVFSYVPLLLKIAFPAPPLVLIATADAFWSWNVPLLFSVVVKPIVPMVIAPLPLHVVVPVRFNVRPPASDLPLLVFSVSGPLIVVVPVPVIVPSVHVDVPGPLTVSVSVPPSVPPVRLSVGVVGPSPLLSVNVPPVMSNVPMLVTVTPLLNVADPADVRVVPATL